MLYDHGLPFSDIVALNIDDCLELIDQKKASCVIIDGLMGEGKTTLAVEIGEYVEKKYNCDIELIKNNKEFYNNFRFYFEKQLSMGGSEFQEKLQLCHDSKLKVLIYDEAGDLSKRGAITQFNRDLLRIFQTYRAFKILVILCLPNMSILDNNLFTEGVPKLLLNCYGRETCGNIRGYGYEEMMYLRHFMGKEVNPLKAYKIVHPNFRGSFLNLPPHLDKKLDEISTNAKTEVLNANILKNKGLITREEIGNKLKRSKSWLDVKLRDLKIKPVQKHKQFNYYDPKVIEQLREFVYDLDKKIEV